MLFATMILLAGLAMSATGALLWRASQARHERQSFGAVASNVTATLGTLLRRNADDVATLRAVLTMDPHVQPTAYATWASTLGGPASDVGNLGSIAIEAVPAARLHAFEARRNVDPSFRAYLHGWVVPVQRGSARTYCLLADAAGTLGYLTPAVAAQIQGDWCSSSSPIGLLESVLLQTQTDTGQIVTLPIDLPYLHTVLVEAAVYRRGAPLASVAERRAAVTSWLVTSFAMPMIIQAAISGNRGIAVDVYHTNPGETPMEIGSAGTRRAGQLEQTRSVSIDGSWTIKVHGTPIVNGFSAGLEGLLVLVTGAIVSLLLFVILLVLSQSRAQALALVDEKTGQLLHQTHHDALTGLPNRTLALDRAEQMLARARRTHVPIAALYIDIDSFKHVNDTFGHAAGDAFLKIVADRLRSVIRASDTAARLAGDEFLVLIEGAPLAAGPQLVAERLLEVLRLPYDMADDIGRQLSLTASIGVVYGERSTAEQLLADADIALYTAKSAGKNRYVLFQTGMQTAALDRLTLEMDLAQALERGELFLVYQPILDLSTEQTVAVEALLRWRHPTRGIVSPSVFVPVAEDCGLIVPIGRWVLVEACRQAAAWHRRGFKLGISVNVSARQFDRDDLIDDVRQALELAHLAPSALAVEITETTLMRDSEATADHLHALKQLGVRIALDDFGTGYSSLAYLRRFPVDALKIDRYFINGVAASKESTAMIQTLVRLGQTLNLTTIAEGIEDRAQFISLQREGCDQGQGFLFAEPMDARAIDSFLSRELGQTAA